MAHQWMRCNLSSAKFPFATKLFGRSIIVPQYDENYDRSIASTADTDKDKGVPQALYMHNVMPTGEGYQSIGYKQAVAGLPDTTDFDSIFPIQTPSLGKFLFVPAQGKNYIFDQTVGSWASVSPISSSFSAKTMVTTAFIRSQTYLFYQNYGGFTYNPTTRTMDAVVFTGLVPANIKGIAAAVGYMLAWDDTSVVWSSTLTETDFTPSLVTGAGGGQLQDAKGKIICCLPISGGFIVYCERNAVAAKYTGNIRFPFSFAEIPGSGGIISPEQVSWQSNVSEHFAWTTNGFQQLDKAKSTNLMPEVTDFMAAKIFEDFDETTLQFTFQNLSTQMNTKVCAVGGRFAIFSYGVSGSDFTHALVYDNVLKRYGKLKITHRDCFQWNAPNVFGALRYKDLSTITYGDLSNTTYLDLLTSVSTPEAPKEVLAFVQQDGTVQLVNFAMGVTDSSGVLMLGKFQFMRNKFIIHLNSDVETVDEDNDFLFYLLYTLDGKDFKPLTTAFYDAARSGPLIRKFRRHLHVQNVSAVMIGAFHINSYLIDFMPGGDN